jgi:hypothetical protein
MSCRFTLRYPTNIFHCRLGRSIFKSTRSTGNRNKRADLPTQTFPKTGRSREHARVRHSAFYSARLSNIRILWKSYIPLRRPFIFNPDPVSKHRYKIWQVSIWICCVYRVTNDADAVVAHSRACFPIRFYVWTAARMKGAVSILPS